MAERPIICIRAALAEDTMHERRVAAVAILMGVPLHRVRDYLAAVVPPLALARADAARAGPWRGGAQPAWPEVSMKRVLNHDGPKYLLALPHRLMCCIRVTGRKSCRLPCRWRWGR